MNTLLKYAGLGAALTAAAAVPALAQDGGDCQFVGLTEDKVVQVRLIGACSTCPSSTATLAFGIERLLVEEFPDIKGVIQV